MRLKPGISVAEGLVAVAITVVVVAVLLAPANRYNREYGARNHCLSNMKQLGLAILQYSHDYHETFPPSKTCLGTDISDQQATLTIVNFLDPYLGRNKRPGYSRRLWRCPSQRGHGLYVKPESDGRAVAGTVWPLHYVCNMNLLRPMGGVYSHYRYLSKAERAKKQPGSPTFALASDGTALTEPVRTKDVEDSAHTLAFLDWHQTGDSPDACIDAQTWDRRMEEDAKSLAVHFVMDRPRANAQVSDFLFLCYADGHATGRQVMDVKVEMFYPDEKRER